MQLCSSDEDEDDDHDMDNDENDDDKLERIQKDLQRNPVKQSKKRDQTPNKSDPEQKSKLVK